MCPDFGRDLPVESSERNQKTEKSDRRKERQSEPEVETNMESEENNHPSSSTEEDTFSKAMEIIEMRKMFENCNENSDETLKVMVKCKETVKTTMVMEEENRSESTEDGLQYELLPIHPSFGCNSKPSTLQLNLQTVPEVIEISSDEEVGKNEINELTRSKPWPKKVDPEESEFYHFENPYSHLEYQSDTE